MVNYMVKFIPHLNLKPLTNLTRKDVPWNWSAPEQEAFDTIKSQLTSTPVIALDNPDKELTVERDPSEFGIGSVLRQEGQPVSYASRMLTDTERRYAQIEKEMLALLFGLEKLHHYTFGRQTNIITDHKPRVTIVSKPMSKAPRRLQSMLVSALMYDFNLTYVPGKCIPVADALSPAPVNNNSGNSDFIFDKIDNLTFSPAKTKHTCEMRDVSQKDEEMRLLTQTISEDWPTHQNDIPLAVRQ